MASQYMDRRQNPVSERPIAETESDMTAIASAFGEPWLNRADDHPIQRLWARRDFLATVELLTLGGAISQLQPLFPGWVKEKVRLIKGGKADRRGAVLELLALHFIRSGGQPARPTPRNFPGYDITTEIGGGSLDISLKNFGASEHEAAARRQWERLHTAYLNARQGSIQRATGLFIAANRYPSDDDWKQLTAGLSELVRVPVGAHGHSVEGGCWKITQHLLPPDLGPYHEGSLSYQLVTAVPHHRNEHANLISYLEKASSNARKHARANEQVARTLFVRLREAASLVLYQQWAQTYMAENSDGPLDAVFFYQPAVVQTQEDKTQVHHALAAVFGQTFVRWQDGRDDRRLSVEVPIGSTGPTSHTELRAGNTRIPLGAHYVFQRGSYYSLHIGAEASLRAPAPGIHQHAILRLPDGGEIVLEGIFPPSGDLMLFD